MRSARYKKILFTTISARALGGKSFHTGSNKSIKQLTEIVLYFLGTKRQRLLFCAQKKRNDLISKSVSLTFWEFILIEIL